MHPLDQLLMEKIQALGPGFFPLMKTFSAIGTGHAYFLIFVLIMWCRDYRLGVKLSLLLSISWMLNEILKLWFHAPRPYMIEPSIRAYEPLNSYGMPSGHAQLAATLYAYIAGRYRRSIFWIVGMLLVGCIALSRVYLGAHSIIQVVAGGIIGGAVGAAFLLIEIEGKEFVAGKPTAVQMTSVFFISGLAILSTEWIFHAGGNAFVLREIADGNLRSCIGSTALFAGLASGFFLFRPRRDIQMRAACWKQLIKIALCFASLMVYLELSKLSKSFAEAPWGGPFIAAYSFLLGIWVTCLAPKLFIRLRLVDNYLPD